MAGNNPFEFDAAPNLDPRQLINWYIEDFNYSRFIDSTRNIILNGERGSGKSMTLIYHSLYYKKLKAESVEQDFDPIYFGVYVPCNTPLHMKQEYVLLSPEEQYKYSEGALIYSILVSIAKEFISANLMIGPDERSRLRDEFAFVLGIPEEIAARYEDPFQLLRREARRRVRELQEYTLGTIGSKKSAESAAFFDYVVPVIEALREITALKGAHFSLLVDDLQDLNPVQQRIVNSWIGYRDHSFFSIKAAVAGLARYDLQTNYGGVLLENHDFISIDLHKPFQSKDTEYGKFIDDLVAKRLQDFGIDNDARGFFPVSERMAKGLRNARGQAEAEAEAKGLKSGTKAWRDYRFKYGRAIYFRSRDPKANRPVYSGAETLKHLSTGVVRNFLAPCFWMYERVVSANRGRVPDKIPSDIQGNVVIEQSDKLWLFVENGMEKQITDCTPEDSKNLYRLLSRLGEYFRERLMMKHSEPRILVFVVSEKDDFYWPKLKHLLSIAEQAMIIYVRTGASKSGGGRETYFVPNRLLWPRYGLDVHGQHGRASIKAVDLWLAAERDRPIPVTVRESAEDQGKLL